MNGLTILRNTLSTINFDNRTVFSLLYVFHNIGTWGFKFIWRVNYRINPQFRTHQEVVNWSCSNGSDIYSKVLTIADSQGIHGSTNRAIISFCKQLHIQNQFLLCFPLIYALSNVCHDLFVLLLITKTYLNNFDSLKPHLYVVKLGFTYVYIILLISAQNHRLWVLRAASSRRS